ncbi:MAG: AmpG family muropeptide MFS transporter [Spongiibacteraceae bacterium]
MSLTLSSWAVNRRLSICAIAGFSSGLPLFLLIQLVPAWLRSEGVDLKSIGLLTLLQLPYTWKFLWAPLADRYGWARFGRRRTWMFAMQVPLLFLTAVLGTVSIARMPEAPHDLATTLHFLSHPVTLLALAIALCSATYDIAVDAYRRELLPDAELGLGMSVFVAAYRVAGLVPGSLSLILADILPWSQVFVITALFVLPGIILPLFISEPANTVAAPHTLREAAIEPMREFLGRAGWRHAAWILGFIFFYKLGDTLCVALATPFYLDMGYTKTEIGIVAKNAGLWASIIGGLLGGVWMLRLGIARALWVFGVVQMLSILGFAWLAANGAHNSQLIDSASAEFIVELLKKLMEMFGTTFDVAPKNLQRWLNLGAVVGLEAFGVGVGTAAFVAFMATQTHKAYTATQYALFSSFAVVPRTLISASAGYLVDQFGWTNFYLLCFALAIPGMLLLLKVAPWNSTLPRD